MNRKKLLQSKNKFSEIVGERDSFFCATHIDSLMHTFKRLKPAQGVTLIEAVVAIAILAIAAVGSLSYQYQAVKHTQIARAQITATRTVQLLLEDWKSTGGSTDYDPQNLELGFSPRLAVPSHWSEGQGVGLGSPLHDSVHSIIIDGFPMIVMLSWEDVSVDTIAGVTLRKLTVIANFEVTAEDLEEIEENPHDAASHLKMWVDVLPPVIMTTYVRIDGTSG